MEDEIVQNKESKCNTSVQQKFANASYYFLYALACLAFANSIFWIVVDYLFNMPGKFIYVFMGVVCGTIFLMTANRIVKNEKREKRKKRACANYQIMNLQ